MSSANRGTSGGVGLDEQRLRELADEAERGYEPRRLRPRSRRGRPPLGSKAASVFQVRLDPELRQSLERRADLEETTPSEIARRALRHFLSGTSPSSGRPASSTGPERANPPGLGAVERREVTPNPSGGWDVRKPSGKRASSHHATQREAIQTARQLLRKQGGGELRIKGRDGRVRDRTVVSGKIEPHQDTG